jgi:hypothetical protein
MKQLTKYILERLVLTKNKKASADSFKAIQMFIQEDQFDENGLSLDYFKGIDSNKQTICYVECFSERFGDRFRLVIFSDDIYLNMVNKYNLQEIEDLGWNEAPEELVEIVQDKLDTELPVYICGVGAWYDSRYNYDDLNRFEQYIEKVYNELK